MRWNTHNPHRGPRRGWVGAAGSLSARLARVGQVFSVQLLAQGRQALDRDEARALGLPGLQAGYVREVLLRVDGIAVVFARSVTAYAASNGPWRSIRGLGVRPLADVLFTRQGISRSPLAFTKIPPTSRLRRKVAHAWRQAAGGALATGALPARRSVFTRCGAPLLVMEVFASPTKPWGWPASVRVSGPTLQLRKKP